MRKNLMGEADASITVFFKPDSNLHLRPHGRPL